MKVKEILEKANEVQEVLHLKSKDPENEGDIQISLVIIKDRYLKKKSISERRCIKKRCSTAMFCCRTVTLQSLTL